MTWGAHAGAGAAYPETSPRPLARSRQLLSWVKPLGEGQGAGQGLILPSGAQLGPEAAHLGAPTPPEQPSAGPAAHMVPDRPRHALALPLRLSPVSFRPAPLVLMCARAWAAVPLQDQTGLTGVGRESCLAEMPRAGTQPLDGGGCPAQRPRGATGAERSGGSFTSSSLAFSPPVCPAVPALAPAQQPGHQAPRARGWGASLIFLLTNSSPRPQAAEQQGQRGDAGTCGQDPAASSQQPALEAAASGAQWHHQSLPRAPGSAAGAAAPRAQQQSAVPSSGCAGDRREPNACQSDAGAEPSATLRSAGEPRAPAQRAGLAPALGGAAAPGEARRLPAAGSPGSEPPAGEECPSGGAAGGRGSLTHDDTAMAQLR